MYTLRSKMDLIEAQVYRLVTLNADDFEAEALELSRTIASLNVDWVQFKKICDDAQKIDPAWEDCEDGELASVIQGIISKRN